MKHLNKVMVCAMIVFIVLLPFEVLASSEEEASLIGAEGAIDNPFMISISNSGGSQTLHFESFPFYFKMNTPGAYEISLDYTKQEVTFMLTDNNVDRITVLIEDDNSDNIDAKQLGIDFKGANKTMISPPTYDISEILLGEPTGIIAGLPREGHHVKEMKLYNVAPRASILASRSNLYFFTNISDSKVKEQINQMYQNGEGAIGIAYQQNVISSVNDVVYEFQGINNTALSSSPADRSSIEAIVTRLFLAIGDNFLLKSMRGLFKENNISINTLIFNQFEPTKLDLYNQSATGLNKTLRETVNFWYNALLTFTYIAYMILLVYIGIMMISSSGTPRQGRAKTFFTNWVVGLVLLLVLPHYGFPLIFKLNDALVAYIGKDAANMDTYYEVYERHNEILGGDSATEAIDKLIEERKNAQRALEQTQQDAGVIVENTINELLEPLFRAHQEVGYEYFRRDLTNRLKSIYNNYKRVRSSLDVSSSKTNINNMLSQEMDWSSNSYGVEQGFGNGIKYSLIQSGALGRLLDKYEEAYQYETQIEQIDKDIITLQNDILGIMRSYAGKYNRLIFGVLFLMLLFQLMGLLILYVKRILVIAILIAIFPLIMLFYCIDKMADNTAQTLSLWFKEFLANVFIQSIHAVIYVVLVQMGLEIYQKDNGNWLLLVMSMMLILPAESIMKTIFNLNGSTLGQIGGMLERATVGIGAIKGLATAGKRSTDKAVTSKEKQFTKNMQRKQTRADNRQTARDFNRAANNVRADGLVKSARNLAYNAGDWAHEKGNKIRENRTKIHNFKNSVGRYTRVARNVGAIAVGAAYGVAGGDENSLLQGAALARTLSGRQGKDEDYVKKQKEAKQKEALKNKVGDAYKRKK